MQAFDVLGSPVRRRILELLAERARASGEIVEAIQREFDISQPGVSQHLSVLRDSGFATSRPDGPRRVGAAVRGTRDRSGTGQARGPAPGA